LRTPREIAFRLKQELTNAYRYARPPKIELEGFAPRLKLPDPAGIAGQLAGTHFAQEVITLAEQVRAHRFPILGLTIEAGTEIRWRRDYVSGIETGLDYFRLIPYLDAAQAGDHKVIWELNRHQHLVVLAQAYLFTGDRANLDEIQVQLESWFSSNPYHRGINWASALEVAFRALSWIWIWHFVGQQLPPDFRTRWLRELYRHGVHLETNLSFYFSPNTHLLGEALALHGLGLFFAGLPKAPHWEQLGGEVMREQMERQVHNDGSHFEQSTYYHVYALDMFILHAVLAKPDRPYMQKLERMAEYLDAQLGPARTLPFIGDDDGGRLFHPYGPRDRFGRATMATASIVLDRHDWQWEVEDLHEQAVWLRGAGELREKAGEEKLQSRLFSDAGIAVMVSGAVQTIVDAGPFGPWGAGHSHADTLSIVVRSGDEQILIDPGTYTYVGDPKWRDWFRGTAAHNTVQIDGLDQAAAAGPFRWANHPEVAIHSWKTNPDLDLLEAECRYAGFTHRRRVEFQKPDLIVIVDEIDGPPGDHQVDQLWHLGSANARSYLVLPDGAEMVESWRSTVFGEKHPSPLVRVRRRGALPMRFEARIQIQPRTK
jgi:Heparinase II/III-like protein/Heparinase II/III N-terminus